MELALMTLNKAIGLTLNRFTNAWQRFWFKEQSPIPLALFRIFFGLFVFQVSLFELAPNFPLLLGVKSMFDTPSVAVYWWQKEPIFNVFLLLPQSDMLRFGFFCIFLVFAFFLTTGLFTRFSAIIVYLGLLSFDRQCPFALDGGDDFMRIVAFLLIFSPAGEAFSLDRILKAKIRGIALEDVPPSMVSPWIQRMIQLQISLVYLFAFLPKIVGDQWQSGTAVYYVFQLTDFAKFHIPKIMTQFPVYKVLTYYTLLVELSMATLVWVKPLRYWILLAAVVLHLGIDWAMNLPCFELFFISSYIVFIDPNDLKKVFEFFRALLKLKPPQNNLIAAKTIRHYDYTFLPMMLFLLSILIFGSLTANPIRKQFVLLESARNYDQRLSKAFNYWTECLKQCTQLPSDDENRLIAQEGLGVILSLKKDYIEAGKQLRSACAGLAQQKKAYNPELIIALSSLANLYLETYHLEAAEFCYKTILNYDIDHFKYAPNRQSIELNNLGVITYFRALLAKDESEKMEKCTEANIFFDQALNKSHNPKLLSNAGIRQIEANILLNQSLILRDLGHFNEAEIAKTKATSLSSGLKKTSLP
jgi:tetratricopeptide (TPR) repeat protein